jgi:hypothetical protein
VRGDTVILDKPKLHKIIGASEPVVAAGALIRYLSELSGLRSGRASPHFSPQGGGNCLAAAGYENDMADPH